MMLRFHTQTAGSSLTAQQPLNNVVRTTIEAMAAVFGGTQSLHTNSYDEALCLPTPESVTLALRTQQIIAHESGIAASGDPLGGSYLIEAWTKRIADEAKARIELIDRMGGMLSAIEQGYPQGEIERLHTGSNSEWSPAHRLWLVLISFGLMLMRTLQCNGWIRRGRRSSANAFVRIERHEMPQRS